MRAMALAIAQDVRGTRQAAWGASPRCGGEASTSPAWRAPTGVAHNRMALAMELRKAVGPAMNLRRTVGARHAGDGSRDSARRARDASGNVEGFAALRG